MGIFQMDGPLYKIASEIADVLLIGILWFFCSLPIITIGASSSAVFYIYGKKARNEDTYIFRDFMKSFKMNFRQSIPVTLILGVMWASMFAYGVLVEAAQFNIIINVLALFFTFEVMVITIYALALLSRFHMKVFNIFVTAFVLAHRHIGTTLLIVGMIIAVELTSFILPILFFMMPIVIMGLAAIPLQRVFKKQIDAMEVAMQQAEAAEEEPVLAEEEQAIEAIQTTDTTDTLTM